MDCPIFILNTNLSIYHCHGSDSASNWQRLPALEFVLSFSLSPTWQRGRPRQGVRSAGECYAPTAQLFATFGPSFQVRQTSSTRDEYEDRAARARCRSILLQTYRALGASLSSNCSLLQLRLVAPRGAKRDRRKEEKGEGKEKEVEKLVSAGKGEKKKSFIVLFSRSTVMKTHIQWAVSMLIRTVRHSLIDRVRCNLHLHPVN